MTEHTPGPWRLSYSDGKMTIKHIASGAVLATERNISHDMAAFVTEIANVAHERSGAPDLLAALQTIFTSTWPRSCPPDWCEMMRAAIAKARQ